MAIPLDPISAALKGENPKVMVRMPTGFAVIGDRQFLPGYSLLLVDDLSVDHLTDLPWARRTAFLFDLSLLGEAVFNVARESGACRINYQILGNAWPHLHGHVYPRYSWEPPELAVGPPGGYPKETRDATDTAYSNEKHGPLRDAITVELRRLMADAFGPDYFAKPS